MEKATLLKSGLLKLLSLIRPRYTASSIDGSIGGTLFLMTAT